MEEPFGDVARRARMRARVSLRTLAESLGWSVVYLSDMERNARRPPREKLREWASAIDLDPDEFERLAVGQRETIELPVATNPNLAFALRRKWGSLTPDQERRVIDILEKEDE